MDTVRDILAGVLAVAAAVMLTLWAPAAWVRDTVVDEQGFLSVAQPLGEQQGFQDEVAKAAVDGVLDQVDVPRPVRSLVEPALQDGATSLARDPVFGQIWDGTVKDLHATLLRPEGGTVSADLNPFVDRLLAPVGDRLGITVSIPDTSSLTLDIVTIPASPWPERIQAFADAAGWMGWAGIGAAVLSLVVASRRGIMMFVLGLLIGVSGVALMFLAQVSGPLVPNSVDRSPILGSLVTAFEQRFMADMQSPSFIVIGAGAAVMAVALVTIGIGTSRRRAREG